MGRLFLAELKKLRSLNIWWLVIAGGILPGIITYLSLYSQNGLEWLGLTNMSLHAFNIQSLLTFASFTTYVWAREYEENTLELVLCYPYPRFCLILNKLIILFLVIVFTSAFFFCTTLTIGRIVFSSMISQKLLWKLMNALLHMSIMHFLLVPMYLCIAMVTKASISGLIIGIANMCICLALSHTSFIQYIPQCLPYVIGDKLMGINSMVVDNSLWVYYSILAVTFILSLAITKVLADRMKK